MEAIDSSRFEKELGRHADAGEPIAVVQNDQVIGCFIPCEERVPLKGFPVLDQIGKTRIYEPLMPETSLGILKQLRYMGSYSSKCNAREV